ncbi:spore coat U domain-containing protein [Oleiagrimonas sp. C23AA]|uniref:Csu type fimbrial protein n=1 Tax=Oleiagrimonas sp. C23AA TaxID=2719047 RepID=UPI00142026D2|nr:spore coat U domain-containing protein [Oleiagrimonas sp. C23AA]NII09428.1 spore coat protein U domain-containing protein [Oleiagrimonas sp. C23AA]
MVRVDRQVCLFGFALILSLGAAPSRAALCGTALDPVTISATSVNFGTYDASAPSPSLSTGNVRLACGYTFALLPAATIRLSRGQGPNYATRRMMAGGQSLRYNLFTSSARTSVWGDGSGGSQMVTVAALLAASMNLTVYGSVAPGQYVRAGAYSDQITVTVEY